MNRIIGLAAGALVLLAATTVSAQQIVTGTVIRVDQPAGVVVLDNGQMYRTTPQTVFLVNNRPMGFTTLQPGTPVVVQYAQPVMYQNGQYFVLAPAAPAGTVVTAPPPGTVVSAPPAVVTSSGIYEVSGIVRWVGASDPGRQSITFDNGRQVWLDDDTQILANGAPAMISTLRPGTFVVVRSSRPFAFKNNIYYTTAVPPAAVVAAPAPASSAVTSGTVVRVDQPNVIVLSDGRVVPATTQTVIMVDNRPVPISAVQPGSHVIIYPNGQTGVVTTDPSAMPRFPYPGIGTRERELERNSP